MLDDSTLVIAAAAVEAAITSMRLHSGPRGAAGASNLASGQVSVSGSVDADGDITWTNIVFSGLAPNQPVAEVSYWDGAIYRGGSVLTGDTSANSAGEYTISTLTESNISN